MNKQTIITILLAFVAVLGQAVSWAYQMMGKPPLRKGRSGELVSTVSGFTVQRL
ncbi:MAG: hypothetical protein J6Y97_14070 [Prevotella sp.]|nr:hypothetical protein [Prevotella sp.]